MRFLTSLFRQNVPFDSASAAALSGAVRAVGGSDAVRKSALDVTSHLHMASGASGQVHVRALHEGGLEMVLWSDGTLRVEPFPHASDVTVFTDHWHDDNGDCVLVRVLDGSSAVDLPFGVMEQALRNSPFTGDAWAISAGSDEITVLVLDGLGHGPLAGNVAIAGIEALRGLTPSSPSDDLRAVHGALKGTVGAAAAVARVASRGVVDFSGIGNIEATLVMGGRRAGLVSFPGIVGQGSPSFRLFRHVLLGRSHLIMHTDGLRARWKPTDYPDLFVRHPALIAGVLFRDCWRQSDDALVLVIEVSDDVHAKFDHLPA